MLKTVPFEAIITNGCQEQRSLAGARLEMVEQEMAQRELWVDDIEEYRAALAEFKKSCLD